MNQTVRRKTRNDLDHALFAMAMFAFLLSETIEPPEGRASFFYALKCVFGVAGVTFALVLKGLPDDEASRSPLTKTSLTDLPKSLLQLQPRQTQTALPGDSVDAKMTGRKLAALWAFVVIFTVATGWIFGSQIYSAVTNPLTPLWHRAWAVLLANYFGWSLFGVWRGLCAFTSELLRRPAAPTNAAPVAPSAVAPAVAARTISAAPPVVLQNGVPQP